MVQEIDKIQKDNIQKIDKDCFILQVLKRLFKNKLALAGGIVVLLFLIVGCLAPVIAPHDPLEVNVSIRLQVAFFSRILAGNRSSGTMYFITFTIWCADHFIKLLSCFGGNIAYWYSSRAHFRILRWLD